MPQQVIILLPFVSPLQKGPDKTSPNYTLLKQQIL